MLSNPADPPAAAYWELTVTLAAEAPETVEAVTNRLWELGAIGVVEEDGSGAPTLRAFFPPGTDAAARAETVREYLGDLAGLELPGAQARVGIAPLAAEPWADAWRAHFRPLPVGRRLLVCPPWEIPSGPEARAILVIEPGRAFGTGGHGSTRSCLALLERALASGRTTRVIDVGCGSGVLGIAAAALGVPHVDAFDLDPDAVAATEANARRNAVSERVRASVADVQHWRGPTAPLVLANLLAAAHVALAPILTALAEPHGAVIAGGLLAHEAPAVAGAFAAEGCWLVEVVEDDGWAALLLRRGA